MPLSSLLPRRRGPRRRQARVPAEVLALVEAGQKVLAAVPVSPDRTRWALALTGSLALVEGERLQAWDWHQVDRAKWEGTERAFTLRWLDPEQAELVLVVPEVLELSGEQVDVDPNPFARVLRERVESVVVHRVSGELPGVGVVSVSVRRGRDGELLTAVSGVRAESLSEADRKVLEELERRVRDGVGLPTE
ncbi:hypothetical protein [Actinomyces weissii]|uniref:Uncharacterized protein n=1 Tax=Actinomyces weissii TaxID=675090 RepID=A0A7T7MB16_9ACTO|nr:hypothetical protein [Actinomyces weissii]QQM68108.1 hypothetical protein JG540_04535 [Actinomyces weissii]